MTQMISRRAALSGALAGLAAVACGGGALAQSARTPFAMWVEAFRSRARARGVSDATYNRVMGRAKARHVGLRARPRAAGIQGRTLAISEPPRLGLADRHRQGARAGKRRRAGARRAGLWRRPLHHAWAVGHGDGLWRRGAEPEAHAARIPGAGGARLGRTSAALLLGAGTAERYGHRRARLGGAE